MTDTLLFALRFVAILGSGVMAGLFFAFSNSVMGGLGRIQPAEGIAAMQSINRVILNPLFLAVFLGTPGLCALVFLSSLWRWNDAGSALLLLGSALYIAGVFLVTIFINVPMNNALNAVQPASAEGAALWTRYLADWTAWNHVRTVASTAALAFLVIGLYLGARVPAGG